MGQRRAPRVKGKSLRAKSHFTRSQGAEKGYFALKAKTQNLFYHGGTKKGSFRGHEPKTSFTTEALALRIETLVFGEDPTGPIEQTSSQGRRAEIKRQQNLSVSHNPDTP